MSRSIYDQIAWYDQMAANRRAEEARRQAIRDGRIPTYPFTLRSKGGSIYRY